MSELPVIRIEDRIHFIRGERVMLDGDLAELYGVATGVLNQAVKRNSERFPEGFSFVLSRREANNLRSQFVISSSDRDYGGRRYRIRAFTEHGVAMLASVLRSPRAIATSVAIIRAFIQLRQIALNYSELAMRIDALEARYDDQFKGIFEAIRKLLKPIERDEPHAPIGFTTE